jgi:hypothetical protein
MGSRVEKADGEGEIELRSRGQCPLCQGVVPVADYMRTVSFHAYNTTVRVLGMEGYGLGLHSVCPTSDSSCSS